MNHNGLKDCVFENLIFFKSKKLKYNLKQFLMLFVLIGSLGWFLKKKNISQFGPSSSLVWDIEYPIVISPCYRQNSQLQTMWCLKIWCPILPIQLKCGFSFYLGLFGLVEDFVVSLCFVDQWKLERCVLELLISFSLIDWERIW